MLQGSGCYYGFGGERYNGQWEKGKRHGLGTQTYRDWNAEGEVYHKYHGNWVNGKREGLGHLTMCKRRSLRALNPSAIVSLSDPSRGSHFLRRLQQMVTSIKGNGRTTGKRGWACSTTRTRDPSTTVSGATTSLCPEFTAATPIPTSWRFHSSCFRTLEHRIRSSSSWLRLGRFRFGMTEPRDE
jgi:hypothetical protein